MFICHELWDIMRYCEILCRPSTISDFPSILGLEMVYDHHHQLETGPVPPRSSRRSSRPSALHLWQAAWPRRKTLEEGKNNHMYVYLYTYIYISILIYSGSHSLKKCLVVTPTLLIRRISDSHRFHRSAGETVCLSSIAAQVSSTVCGFPRGTSAAKTAPKTAESLMSSRCQSQWVRMRFFSSVRKKDRNHMWSPTSDVCDTSLW